MSTHNVNIIEIEAVRPHPNGCPLRLTARLLHGRYGGPRSND